MTLQLDISTDFAMITDWLAPVTVSGVIVESALRRAITVKQVQASGGKYLSSDVTFHLDRAELQQQPKLGTQIIDSDGRWTILGVHWETLANRWKCVCRKLSIDRCSTVTIQRATYAKSVTGAAEPTWATLATGVVAKVQFLQATVEADRSNRTTQKTATVFFLEEQSLQPSDRIISGSTTLKVLAWNGFSELEQLFTADCEVSIWPQA